MSGFFITGTDTDVGKTLASEAIISALAAHQVSVVGLKPIASGFEDIDGVWCNQDVQALTHASNVVLPPQRVNRYAFTPFIAPHIAAEQTDERLDFELIEEDVRYAQQRASCVIVEGVGGWHVPLISDSPEQDIERLAQLLGFPVILVVGLRLGCLNHAKLTANAIIASGLPLVGWVANHIDPDFLSEKENLATLEATLPAPKLFDIPYLTKREDLTLAQIKSSQFIVSCCENVKNS